MVPGKIHKIYIIKQIRSTIMDIPSTSKRSLF